MKAYLRRDLSPTVSHFNYPITRFEGIDADAEESYLPMSWGSYGYNITIKNGVLKSGIGIGVARINGENIPNGISVGSRMIKGIVFSRIVKSTGERDDILVALMQNRKLYYARFDDPVFTYSNITFDTLNVTLLNFNYNEKDCLLILGEDGQSYIFDGDNFSAIPNTPKMTHACIHNGRVYGTVSEGRNTLYFSDDLDPTNWNISLTEGGYINFPDEGGKVTGVISFNGNLFIFREYAIHRLSAFVEQSDYVLTKVFYGNNRIYFPTAAVCNDFMVFLAEDGFYMLDGYKCTRILRNLAPLIGDKTYSVACFFDHKYHVALNIVRDDELVGDEAAPGQNRNNGMIIYDFDTKEISIMRGTDIGFFLPISLEGLNVMFLLFGSPYRGYNVGVVDDTGRLMGEPLKKLWRSPRTDFSVIDKDKVLRRIHIRADTSLQMVAGLDKDYEFILGETDSEQMIPVNHRGNKVCITLSTDKDKFTVRGLNLEFDFVRRKYE